MSDDSIKSTKLSNGDLVCGVFAFYCPICNQYLGECTAVWFNGQFYHVDCYPKAVDVHVATTLLNRLKAESNISINKAESPREAIEAISGADYSARGEDKVMNLTSMDRRAIASMEKAISLLGRWVSSYFTGAPYLLYNDTRSFLDLPNPKDQQ